MIFILALTFLINQQKVSAVFTITPDPFGFGDEDASCDTHVSVIDNNGEDSIVVGGFTQSKSIVWADPSNIVPGKATPASMTPSGCYSDTTYMCGASALSGDDTGTAYIFKAIASTAAVPITATDENISWKKFFENYNQVTAIKFSRSDTNND
jgi:hypothetical protein